MDNKNKVDIKKLYKGGVITSTKNQFNDYWDSVFDKYLGQDIRRMAVVIENLNDSNYFLLTFSTSNNKGREIFNLKGKTIKFNVTDSFVFTGEMVEQFSNKFVGYIQSNTKHFQAFSAKAKEKGQISNKNKHIVKDILSAIDNNDKEVIDFLLALQFSEPTVEDKYRKETIVAAGKGSDDPERRAEYIKSHGIEPKYEHGNKKNYAPKTNDSSDNEPQD